MDRRVGGWVVGRGVIISVIWIAQLSSCKDAGELSLVMSNGY